MYPRQRQGVNKGEKLEDREDWEVLIGQGNEDEVIHETNVVWRLNIISLPNKVNWVEVKIRKDWQKTDVPKVQDNKVASIDGEKCH